MFLSLTVERLEYTYNKSFAFIRVLICLFISIAYLLKLILNFQETDWWLILMLILATIFLIVFIKRLLTPVLSAKVAIEITDECIINRGEKIEFTAINDFVLYPSGVIAVILNEPHKRPKNILKWLDYRFTTLFYRSYVIIDTRGVNVKGPALFNSLVDRLDSPKLNAAL
jgi:hypothetical protein